MAIICEKCGGEFSLSSEAKTEKVFCPYCGAQVGAEEMGEICLSTDEPVKETPAVPAIKAPEPAVEQAPKKPLLDESFWRVVLTVVVSAVLLGVAALLTWGTVALFGWLFSFGWGFW